MNRTAGWSLAQVAFGFLVACSSGAAMAQQAEQHWQGTPNNSSSYGPNYQPPAAPDNAQAAPSPTAQGGNPYQQNQPAAGQPYPTIERRDGSQPAQPQYGPPATADNRQAYPQQYPPAQDAAQAQYGQGQYGQGQYGQGQTIQGPPPGPIQGPPPQGPDARPIAPKAPFVLSPVEINNLENLLADWEKRNREIHVLDSKFYRWKYDAVFGAPGNGLAPPPPQEGQLRFAAPDKAWLKVESKDPKQPGGEQWLCDGKSVFQWDYSAKVVTEFIMPRELQGKGIGDGPLPFVFGIEAQKLKQRYFMRISTPPNVQNEVWLEAYPKWQPDAANYSKVEVILQVVGPMHALFPYAIQIYSPNGKDRVVYQLQNPTINPRGGFLVDIWGHDDWKPSIDRGWTKKTQLPQTVPQSGMSPGMIRR